jgi:pimeloyl-ACP methyl ester carboxylesterase
MIGASARGSCRIDIHPRASKGRAMAERGRVTEPDSKAFLETPAREIDTGTARVPCRVFGGGPALLLVHGFPLSGFTWRKLLPELSRHYTCYVPDLPGMGGSRWTDATDFSFPGQGRTLKALVDRLRLERYAVLAQDTGGTFARWLALEDGERVAKLALINTEIPRHRPPFIPLYQLLMRMPGAPASLGLLSRSRAFLRSPMGFGGCFSDLSLIDGDFREQVVEPLVQSATRRDGMRRYLIGAKWDAVDVLEREHARLVMPVRLIWGADDPTRARDAEAVPEGGSRRDPGREAARARGEARRGGAGGDRVHRLIERIGGLDDDAVSAAARGARRGGGPWASRAPAHSRGGRGHAPLRRGLAARRQRARHRGARGTRRRGGRLRGFGRRCRARDPGVDRA